MPLMDQIDKNEWERLETFSDQLFGDDRLIFLIDDGIEAGNFGHWLELDAKTLAVAKWGEEPPMPWDDATFRRYWTARGIAAEVAAGEAGTA